MSLLEKMMKVVRKSSGDEVQTTADVTNKTKDTDLQPPERKRSKTNLMTEKAKKKAAAVDKFEAEIINTLRSVAETRVTKEEMTAYMTSSGTAQGHKSKAIHNPLLVDEYREKSEELLSESLPAEKSIIPHEVLEIATKAKAKNSRTLKKKRQKNNARDAKLRSTMTRQQFEEFIAKREKEQNITEDELNTRRRNKMDLSIKYLLQWKNDRASWKFAKVHQMHLLKFMYKHEEEGGIPNEHFHIFMDYCQTELTAACKKRTRDEATSILEEIKNDFAMPRADLVLKSLSDGQE